MKDALGKELVLGQRVAIPKNSIFAIGVLYNVRPNRSKWYLQAVDYVERKARGIVDDEVNRWRDSYWTPEYVAKNDTKYYIRYDNGKTRTLTNIEAIIGVPNDAKIGRYE